MKVSTPYFIEVLIHNTWSELAGFARGNFSIGSPATHWNSEEPAEVWDIEVIIEGKNITDDLSAKEIELIHEKLIEAGYEKWYAEQERE